MLKVFQIVIDWSEVWALLIPISLLLLKKQPAVLKPVVFYVWIALIIDVVIDITWKIRTILPAKYNSNNYLYNLHSVIRFFLFSTFFIRLKQPFLTTLKKIIPFFFVVFVVVNFCFYENFFDYWKLSSRLLSVEAILLLFYTLQYYLFKINDHVDVNIFNSDFWIVTGLGIYVTINFFIFLLYNELTIRLQHFAVTLWNAHNISYIVFNLFIAKGFYESREQ
ncbi:hypothetical protein [Mucilaginibacter lappiensis]|uniref:Putative neutral ceramidase superfamily lipid hydrolase n=1 Tax=Mucilaginibacter lappiensis TaxID=354630 RepID=A0A841J9M9_9SPHI|nr:hypothetical protein [Mucilaginibacter lappiensis]MBB6127404.1 putative neutral ceramidase superfamily lipid hydrolase [Mucilaginibacter lappiensis]